jgi:CBS domain-containing protein
MNKKQNLYLVFGGKLEKVGSSIFRDVKKLDFVGIYNSINSAKKEWKIKSIKKIDDAMQCYKVVPLNNLLDPTEKVFEYLQKLKQYNIIMDSIVLKPKSTIKKACKLLKEKKSGAAIIMTKNSLKGIFTEKDLVNIFADSNEFFVDLPIEKYMTKNVITIEPNESIIKALDVMKSNSIRHLPVYNKKENILYGVISYKDFTLKIME